MPFRKLKPEPKPKRLVPYRQMSDKPKPEPTEQLSEIDSLEINVRVRQVVSTILDLCEDELAAIVAQHGPAAIERFWVLLGYRATNKAGKIETPRPAQDKFKMTDEQAKLFGKVRVPWGKHLGKRVDEVELSYWFFIAEKPDDFRDDLKRYLRSDYVQREQEG